MFSYFILFILASPLNNVPAVYNADSWEDLSSFYYELRFDFEHYTGVRNTNILMYEYNLSLKENTGTASEESVRKFENDNVRIELKEVEEETYFTFIQENSRQNNEVPLNVDDTYELIMSNLPNIRREEKCLILTTDIEEKKFCDVPPPPNSEGIGIVKNYKLKNYIERINSYILSITHYESGEYILVNGNSGEQEKIFSYKVYFSPSGNYFISTEPDYGYGLINGGGFMIWNTNNPPVLIIDSSQFGLVGDLDNPIWIDDNLILFSRKMYSGNFVYHMMTIKYK